MVRKIQCSRCVMDTTDPDITFNEKGMCNHCINAEKTGKYTWFPGKKGEKKLQELIREIKNNGIGKQYDAIAGISGGIDSSYLIHKAANEWDLRILAIHVDAGWNNNIAINNIKSICSHPNIDLKIIKIDWEEMRRLQLAFLKSGVPNQDIPQDHAFFSTLYQYSVDNNIDYVLNGSNWVTESILPISWGYNASDGGHIKDIFKRHGEGELKSYPITSIYKLKIYYPKIKKLKIVRPLNLIDYNKDEAMKELINDTEWEYYGGKHFESKWTKFFQAYYLPKKFGYDKRKAHLSSLIMSGQITRDAALLDLESSPYDENTIEKELEYIANRLLITEKELKTLINNENGSHDNYFQIENSLLYKLMFRINKVIRK